jgi:hypothetical protein
MTAPAFIYTSEPWAALSFGRPIFRPSIHELAWTTLRWQRRDLTGSRGALARVVHDTGNAPAFQIAYDSSANRHEALVLIMHAVGEANVLVLPTIFRNEIHINRHSRERLKVLAAQMRQRKFECLQ